MNLKHSQRHIADNQNNLVSIPNRDFMNLKLKYTPLVNLNQSVSIPQYLRQKKSIKRGLM